MDERPNNAPYQHCCLVKVPGTIHQKILGCLIVFAVILYVVLQSSTRDTHILQQMQRDKCPVQKHRLTVNDVNDLSSVDTKAIKCRFQERKEMLKVACANHTSHVSRTDIKTFAHNKISICMLQKVGSQFWLRYINEYKSIDEDDEGVRTSPKTKRRDAIKFVFVRNPYTRLLSGFVDKLFSPNPVYWGSLGRKALQSSRRKERGNVTCGTDVTFTEFVEYILKLYHNDLPIDRHFIPIQLRCQFCEENYDYIGKMETFLEDMLFISDAIGALQHNHTREFILREGFGGTEGMLYRNSRNIVKKRQKGILKCGLTLLQAFKLNWRRWQIRGFIESKFDFPFKPGDANQTWERLYDSAVDAHASSDRRKLAEAKKEALREAYSTLPLKTKLKLKAMFSPQFDMFGYEAMPQEVFGNFIKPINGFSFFEKKSILDSD